MGRRLISLVIISLIVMSGVEVYGGQDVVLDGAVINRDIAGNGTLPDGKEPFDGDATGNSITLLNGAKVIGEHSVYGARMQGADGVDGNNGNAGSVSGNRAVINDGSKVSGDVYGGYGRGGTGGHGIPYTGSGGAGEAANNIVKINSGTIAQNVFGGYGCGGNGDYGYFAGGGGVGAAVNNRVEIRGGNIEQNIYGGYVGGNGEAVDNRVEIRGAVEFGADSEIYGGRVKVMGVGREKVKMDRGEEVEYEGTKSGKVKVGCVCRYNRDRIIKPYVGIWYEGEVLGEVRGKIYGNELPVSDMRGGSVIGEVGGRIEQGRMRIEMGVKGYGGNKQGVEGMFRLGYKI